MARSGSMPGRAPPETARLRPFGGEVKARAPAREQAGEDGRGGRVARPAPIVRRHLIAIRLGIASFAFGSVSVSTPSSTWAPMRSWSILLDSENERAKWPTLYSV